MRIKTYYVPEDLKIGSVIISSYGWKMIVEIRKDEGYPYRCICSGKKI